MMIEVITCIECENYEPLDIKDQFGNLVKHTGRGYCKHNSQRGERRDDDWCKWRIPKQTQWKRL